MELDVRRPKLKKTTPYSRQRASQLDSFDGEVEGEKAELLPRLDLLGEASSGGDARRRARLWCGHGARVKVSWSRGSEGTSEGRERAGPGGLVLSTREGGGPERGAARGQHRRHGGMATVPAVTTVTMVVLPIPPGSN